MNHTPGPWKAEQIATLPADTLAGTQYTYEGWRLSGAGNESICAIFNQTERTRANAKLIAAAPAMFEALLAVDIFRDTLSGYVRDKLDLAIAQAKGN